MTFNLESLVLPDSQVHPFYTPSSRPIFGDVRRCSTMVGDVRRCSARFGEVRRCSAMLSDVQRCSVMFDDVRRGSAMFDDVRRYYPMFSDIIRASIHDRDNQPPLNPVERWISLCCPTLCCQPFVAQTSYKASRLLQSPNN